MKIVVICEGKTEAALSRGLREYVQNHSGNIRRIGLATQHSRGRIYNDKLAVRVRNLLANEKVVGVIALSDVYPDFQTADATKEAVLRKAGDARKDDRFRVHVAKFEVEAWLMPFWVNIARKLGVSKQRPPGSPEEINGQKPPSHHLKDLFRRAKRKTQYEKVTEAPKWLTAENLETAAKQCPELSAFLNSLIELAQTRETN